MKKWITDEEMLDCIALSQAVPGMIALNVATFVGYKKRGVAGGVIASVGWCCRRFNYFSSCKDVDGYR